MNDENCPYCGAQIEINHDDGYGYEEDQTHQQECSSCGKIFIYTTSIHLYYELNKAKCLNGEEHEFMTTLTYPYEFTRWQCEFCKEERPLNVEEKEKFLTTKERMYKRII